MADVPVRNLALEHAAMTEEAQASAVSWPAIAAGGVASAALTLVLLAFGTGMGFAVVSPWPSSGVSATTFGIGAGLYLIVVAMMASSIGGYIAGRLRTNWVGVHGDEVYFRDTAHGLLAWALATVLGAAVLASTAASIIGTASSGVAQVAGMAAQNAGPADDVLDRLLRVDPAAPRPPQGTPVSRAELLRLLTPQVTGKTEMAAPDRQYVTQVIAARTGLSQADADKRLTEVVLQARTAADTARKAALVLALWLTASLLMGGLSAGLAATEGGRLRQAARGY